MPEFTDFFGYPAQTSFNLGAAIDLLEYDPVSHSLELKVDPEKLYDYLGSYEIKMILTDKAGGSKVVSFFISILDLESNTEENSEQKFKFPP